MSGVWVPDWTGQQRYAEGVKPLWNWRLNPTQYPQWDTMVDSWQLDGVKPLLYMNPYLQDLSAFNLDLDSDLFSDAEAANYLIKDKNNDIYMLH